MLPSVHGLYSIGSPSKRWKDGYFTGNIVVTGLVDGVDVATHQARHQAGGGDALPWGSGGGLDADKVDGLHASELGGGGPHATSHETGGSDKVHFADLEHFSADATLHDALTSTPHISQAEKDKIHIRLHALDSALDHSGTITDTQHGSRGSGLHADSHARQHALDSSFDHTGTITDAQHGSRGSGLHADSHPQLHKDSHKSGGGDAFALADLLDCLARLEIKKVGTSIGKRRGLNLIEGANVTLTVADDPANEEVDVTIAASGGGGGAGLPSAVAFLADGANVAWTNQPAALTEFLGATRHRTKADLTNATQVRLIVNVMTAGAATPAKIRAQYSIDLSTWYYLDGTSGPSVDINTTGLKVSAWVNLAAGAKADVYLRIVGIDGDGAKDPAFGNIALQVK